MAPIEPAYSEAELHQRTQSPISGDDTSPARAVAVAEPRRVPRLWPPAARSSTRMLSTFRAGASLSSRRPRCTGRRPGMARYAMNPRHPVERPQERLRAARTANRQRRHHPHPRAAAPRCRSGTGAAPNSRRRRPPPRCTTTYAGSGACRASPAGGGPGAGDPRAPC